MPNAAVDVSERSLTQWMGLVGGGLAGLAAIGVLIWWALIQLPLWASNDPDPEIAPIQVVSEGKPVFFGSFSLDVAGDFTDPFSPSLIGQTTMTFPHYFDTQVEDGLSRVGVRLPVEAVFAIVDPRTGMGVLQIPLADREKTTTQRYTCDSASRTADILSASTAAPVTNRYQSWSFECTGESATIWTSVPGTHDDDGYPDGYSYKSLIRFTLPDQMGLKRLSFDDWKISAWFATDGVNVDPMTLNLSQSGPVQLAMVNRTDSTVDAATPDDFESGLSRSVGGASFVWSRSFGEFSTISAVVTSTSLRDQRATVNVLASFAASVPVLTFLSALTVSLLARRRRQLP